MDYEIQSWPVRQLAGLVEAGAINLRPPYQRNDIWTTAAKRRLLQTIHLGFPLPAFFLHEIEPKKKYDMVDGQQRTRTIVGYLNGLLKNEGGKLYSTSEDPIIQNYLLAVVVIRNVEGDASASMRDFYYRVNKYGTKLNRPEIIKAQYANTPLQELVETIADSEPWEELNLFTQEAQDRMADLDFISELLTLIRFGITDKKLQVDRFYADTTFTSADAQALNKAFNEVLERIKTLNESTPLVETRYRQRNDFYTLFNFVHTTPQLSEKELLLAYSVLTAIGPSITPSNEECFALQEYAINCVSQSHLKKSREARHAFFTAVLLNEEKEPVGKDEENDKNPVLGEVMRYFGLEHKDLVPMNKYFIPNPKKLSS